MQSTVHTRPSAISLATKPSTPFWPPYVAKDFGVKGSWQKLFTNHTTRYNYKHQAAGIRGPATFQSGVWWWTKKLGKATGWTNSVVCFFLQCWHQWLGNTDIKPIKESMPFIYPQRCFKKQWRKKSVGDWATQVHQEKAVEKEGESDYTTHRNVTEVP